MADERIEDRIGASLLAFIASLSFNEHGVDQAFIGEFQADLLRGVRLEIPVVVVGADGTMVSDYACLCRLGPPSACARGPHLLVHALGRTKGPYRVDGREGEAAGALQDLVENAVRRLPVEVTVVWGPPPLSPDWLGGGGDRPGADGYDS